jgi:hypothetical protein
VAADNKNDYGTKSPLEKKQRINIVRNAIRTFAQKIKCRFCGEQMIKDYYYKHLSEIHPQ